MANFVLPSLPAILPMALDKWSPCKVLTSLISNVSIYKSSNLNKAMASSISKPNVNSLMKSAPFCKAPGSVVFEFVFNSTVFVLKFILTCNFKWSTNGGYILGHVFFKGVILCGGTGTFLDSNLTFAPDVDAALKRGFPLSSNTTPLVSFFDSSCFNSSEAISSVPVIPESINTSSSTGAFPADLDPSSSDAETAEIS